jgi:Flp pilus assembly pilin Flp
MGIRKRRGQSTVEYVLVLTAILAAIIVITGKMYGKVKDGMTGVQGRMGNILNKVGDKMVNLNW